MNKIRLALLINPIRLGKTGATTAWWVEQKVLIFSIQLLD